MSTRYPTVQVFPVPAPTSSFILDRVSRLIDTTMNGGPGCFERLIISVYCQGAADTLEAIEARGLEAVRGEERPV